MPNGNLLIKPDGNLLRCPDNWLRTNCCGEPPHECCDRLPPYVWADVAGHPTDPVCYCMSPVIMPAFACKTWVSGNVNARHIASKVEGYNCHYTAEIGRIYFQFTLQVPPWDGCGAPHGPDPACDPDQAVFDFPLILDIYPVNIGNCGYLELWAGISVGINPAYEWHPNSTFWGTELIPRCGLPGSVYLTYIEPCHEPPCWWVIPWIPVHPSVSVLCPTEGGFNCTEEDGCCGDPCISPCCIDGACYEMTLEDCWSHGGIPQGSDKTCEEVDCLRGACCHDDGTCTEGTQLECNHSRGHWKGRNTVCESEECDRQRCCLPSGDCINTTRQRCLDLNGIPSGFGRLCENEGPCPPPGCPNCLNAPHWVCVELRHMMGFPNQNCANYCYNHLVGEYEYSGKWERDLETGVYLYKCNYNFEGCQPIVDNYTTARKILAFHHYDEVANECLYYEYIESPANDVLWATWNECSGHWCDDGSVCPDGRPPFGTAQNGAQMRLHIGPDYAWLETTTAHRPSSPWSTAGDIHYFNTYNIPHSPDNCLPVGLEFISYEGCSNSDNPIMLLQHGTIATIVGRDECPAGFADLTHGKGNSIVVPQHLLTDEWAEIAKTGKPCGGCGRKKTEKTE